MTLKHFGFIDDQPITSTPETCTKWPCDGAVKALPYQPNRFVPPAPDAPKIWTCEKCKANYGFVET